MTIDDWKNVGIIVLVVACILAAMASGLYKYQQAHPQTQGETR